MRRLFGIIFCILVFSAAVSVHAATMQNDSESIDLPGAAGADAISGDSGQGNTDGSGQGGGTGTFTVGDQGNTGGGNTGGSGGNTGGSGGQGDSGDVVVVLGQAPGTTATSTTETDAVVNLLTSSGAVTINNSGTAQGAGSNSGTSITLSGATLRAALRGAGISKLSVFGWDLDAVNAETESYKSEASFTPRDVSLIASSAVLANQSIQSVELSGGTLIVSYLSRGWVLWFIPVTFTVTVTVDAAAPEGQRVTVAFPWYVFITWVEVSPRELAADLNAAIIGSNAAGITPEEAQARLFTQVTKVLKGVTDAVPDTIR